jgi:O-antigen ligase
MSFLKILAFLNVFVFLGIMLFGKMERNKAFILFILLTYPLQHILLFADLHTFEVIVFGFYFIFYKRSGLKNNETISYGYLLIFLSIVVIVGFVFSTVGIDSENFIKFITIFPVFIFGKIFIDECISDPTFLASILKCFRFMLGFAICFLLLQMAFGLKVSLVKTLNPNVIITNSIRYPGIFSDPQQFSQFLGACSFLCLIKFDDQKLPKINLVLFGLSVISIMAAGGRAGLMGWILGLLFLLFFSKPKYKFAIILAAAVIFFVALNFQDKLSIFNRGSDLNETYDFRAGIWEDAIEIFQNNPFWGIGLGNYGKYVFLHYPDQIWIINNEISSFDQPESGYLLILTEMGALGFASIFTFVIFPIFQSFYYYLKTKDLNFILMISSILCWLIGFYSTYSLGDVRIKILVGSIIALMIVYRTLKKSTEETEIEEDINSETITEN